MNTDYEFEAFRQEGIFEAGGTAPDLAGVLAKANNYKSLVGDLTLNVRIYRRELLTSDEIERALLPPNAVVSGGGTPSA